MTLKQRSSRNEFERNRSRRIFQAAQYNWIIVPVLLAVIYTFVYRLLDDPNSHFHIPVDDSRSWSWESFLWLVLVFPGRPLHWLCMLATCSPLKPFDLAKQPVKRSFNRLLICLVTRGDQEEVVKRSVLAAQDIGAKLDERVSFHVLTEAANAGRFRGMFQDHVLVHGVPRSYRPLKAMYKARSLEWFRINLALQDDDWVLHIDEETIIDEYLIKACLDFITRQDSNDLGTGVIHYNIEGYWKSLLPTIGDISRLQDDWGRCQWAANNLRQAAIGIHGSFLLLRGKVENSITWETDHVTEDYWFLLSAMRKDFRIGWVPAIARELSPASVHDYIRQRRRWYTGIRTLNQVTGKLVLASWLWGLLEPVFHILCFMRHGEPQHVPRWFFYVAVLEITSYRVFTFLAIFVQDWDAGLPWSKMVYSQILAQLLGPWVGYLDSYAVLTSLVSPEKGFYVITKN